MWKYISSDDELYHYGVLGMKWGVRKKDYKLTNKRKTNISNEEKTSDKNKKKKYLTKKTKILIGIGATAAATALGVVAYKKIKDIRKEYNAPIKIDKKTGLPLLQHSQTDKEILKNVNPGNFGLFGKKKNIKILTGGNTNCQICTAAYDLRKRGYDVKAKPFKIGLDTNSFYSLIYDNYDFTKTKRIYFPKSHSLFNNKGANDMLKQINKACLEYPNGSRGNITNDWIFKGGHSMIWEKQNGKIVFKDGQTNQVYKDFRTILRASKGSIGITRTDNLKINPDFVKQYMFTDNNTKIYIDNSLDIAKNVSKEVAIDTAIVGSYSYLGKGYYKHYKNKKKGGNK